VYDVSYPQLMTSSFVLKICGVQLSSNSGDHGSTVVQPEN
jgi:hypothetical protein